MSENSYYLEEYCAW